MKKKISRIVSLAFTACVILTGCDTPAEKVEKASVNVIEANQKLDKAEADYAADVETFRRESEAKIIANEKSMAELQAKIANQNAETKTEYDDKIIALQQKNINLKKRMDDYRADGEERWEIFKIDFNKDVNEIKESLNTLSAQCAKNTK
jgi:hypothetical protein